MRVSGETKAFFAALVILVAAIVLHDILRPAAPAYVPEPRPTAEPRPEVRRGLDKTPLLYPGEYLQSLTVRLGAALVAARPEVPGSTHRMTTGFVLNDAGDIVIAAAGFAENWQVWTGGGEAASATMVGLDPVHGIALLKSELSRPAASLEVAPASTVVAAASLVGLRAAPDAPPDLRMMMAPGSPDTLRERLEVQQLPAGEVVVDLDGRLHAFVAGADGDVLPLLSDQLREIVQALLQFGRHPHPWLGVELQTIDATLRDHFETGSIVAVHVEPGSPAEEAGIMAGMTFLEVKRYDDHAVQPEATAGEGYRDPAADVAISAGNVEELIGRSTAVVFVAALPEAEEIVVRVGDRQTPRGLPNEDPGGPGVHPVTPEPGVPIIVSVGGTGALYGLQTGDLIEAVDRQPLRTPDQLEEAVASAAGQLLTVRRHGRRFFVALPARSQQHVRSTSRFLPLAPGP